MQADRWLAALAIPVVRTPAHGGDADSVIFRSDAVKRPRLDHLYNKTDVIFSVQGPYAMPMQEPLRK